VQVGERENVREVREVMRDISDLRIVEFVRLREIAREIAREVRVISVRLSRVMTYQVRADGSHVD